MPEVDLTDVSDRDSDVYGRGYYEKHLVSDLGQPEISTRMRRDLPERSLHWLRTVQKYCPSGGSVLEVGCGHGGALALFEACGFKATGLELSPWLVELARATWGVDVRCGPVERQKFKPASFDTIALFDVLEHLQDPTATLQVCARLLKPTGVLIVQTPEHRPDRTYASIIEEKDPFAQLFIPEHLYLFTRESAHRLLNRADLPAVVFEDAIFDHYDQYFVAARKPPREISVSEIESGMTSSVPGRLTQALLDQQLQIESSAKSSALVRELSGQIQERDRGLKKLDEQLTKLNKEARLQLDDKQSALKAAHRRQQELTAIVQSLEVRMQDLDAQVATVNAESQEQLTKKQQALEEAERQRQQLVDLLQSSEARLADLDQQLKQLNTLAQQQAQEANQRLISMQEALDAQQRKHNEALIENTRLTQEIRDRARPAIDSNPLHRAHRETSLANRLLSIELPAPTSGAVWTPCPGDLSQLDADTHAVQSHLETVEQTHDTIRIGGWAYTLNPDFVPARPILVLAGPSHPWVLAGQRVERQDVHEHCISLEANLRPASAWGFVFEFPISRLPAKTTSQARIGFGWLDNQACLSAPFELLK